MANQKTQHQSTTAKAKTPQHVIRNTLRIQKNNIKTTTTANQKTQQQN